MLIYLSLVSLVIITTIAVINWITAPRLNGTTLKSQTSKCNNGKKVSILIPARNEEKNILDCLTSITSSTYRPLEILVADDDSTDQTASIVDKFIRDCLKNGLESDLSIKLVRINTPLPNDITGKSRACSILADHATGEIFIFCDADVRISNIAIRLTVENFEKNKLDSFSVLPKQKGGSTWAYLLVVTVTQFSILLTLPLQLVLRHPSPQLVAGNGQWFAFTKRAYITIGGHKSVALSRVEDIDLAKLIKSHKMRYLSIIDTNHISVFMYQNISEAWIGFRKNLFSIMGQSLVISTLTLGIAMLIFASPYLLYLNWGLTGFIVSCLCFCFIGISMRRTFRTPWIIITLLPLGVATAFLVLLDSIIGHYRGDLSWKGRILTAPLKPD